MNKKTINSVSANAILKLKSLAKEKESVRSELEVTAKQLAVTAKEKEKTRSELEVTAKQLAVTAKEKEDIRVKLEATATQLAVIAKEKESVRIKLEITAKQLARAKATDEAMLDSIGDGILATDEMGIITLVNKAAEKLLTKKSRELTGTFSPDAISLEDEKGALIPAEKQPISLALATGEAGNAVYYYTRKDGIKFPMAIMCSPIILDKKVIGAIKVFRDITQEKEIDRSKSEFVSVASHQLKTPATIVNFYTERLLNGANSVVTPKQVDYINEIRGANQRMIEIVNTLLNVSRIEMGIFPVDPMPVDVIEIFKNAVKESHMGREKKNLVLKERYHRLKHMIPIDALMLKMIFSNLISNAIKYTSAGGTISIETSEEEKNLLISVSDNGCGIPLDQQDKIFTKFFRSDNARRQDTDGTGLGLYIVKSVLDHIGGKVWFSSKEKEGSNFYFTIPLSNLKL